MKVVIFDLPLFMSAECYCKAGGVMVVVELINLVFVVFGKYLDEASWFFEDQDIFL